VELDAWIESRKPDQSGAPTPNATLGAPARSAFLPPPPSLSGLPPWPVALLGRERETELLEKAWTAASRGHQKVLLISGDPGQGKTRLALELARLLAQHATVLLAGCDREALVPFAPFVTMLQWLLRASTDAAYLKDVEGSIELVQLVPEIAKRVPRAPEVLPATAEGRRFRMFEAFTQLLVLISCDSPILLLFEDFQWADTGSLIFLRHLIRSSRNAAICIVITHRENEPSPHCAFGGDPTKYPAGLPRGTNPSRRAC
jgi:predicted ATPase